MDLDFAKRIEEIQARREAMWEENTNLCEEKEQLTCDKLGDPCRFCHKGQPYISHDLGPNDRKGWTVECLTCGVQTPRTATLAGALLYWDAMLKVKDKLEEAERGL